MQISVAK